MKVLVIGAGNMGSAFVKQLHCAGHQVSVTAKNSDNARELAAKFQGLSLVASGGAAHGQDAIVLATRYEDAVDALRSLGDLAGVPVIDITNPLNPDFTSLSVGGNTSAAEVIAQAMPGAEIVKAFNTLFAQVLDGGADFGGGRKVSVFVASNSESAKTVARLLAKSMGFEVIDAGGLKNARYLEPLAGLNIYLGYVAGLGTGIAPTWMHKA